MNATSEDSLDKLTNLIEAEAKSCPMEEGPPAESTPSSMFKKRTNNIMSMLKRQNIPFPSNPFTQAKELNSPVPQKAFHIPEVKDKQPSEISTTEQTFLETEKEEQKETSTIQSEEIASIEVNPPATTLIGALSTLKSDFNLIERLLQSEEQLLGEKNEEIQSLRQISFEQNTTLNEVIVEIDETHSIINQQLEMIQCQQQSIQTLNKIKSEVQAQLKNIDGIIEENEKYITSTNEKVCSLVDECQKWKSLVGDMKKELESSEESKRIIQKGLESTLQSRESDFQTIQNSHKREKEILSSENSSLREQNEQLSSNLESLGKTTRDLQQKYKRICDNFKVDYHHVIKGEETDLIKIYSFVESHLQQERLCFRKNIKSLGEQVEQLTVTLAAERKERSKAEEKIKFLEKEASFEETKESEKYSTLFLRYQELESTSNATIQSLSVELESMKKEHQEQKSLNNNLQLELQSLNQQLQMYKSNYQPNENFHQMKTQIDTLKEELEKKSAGIADALRVKNTEIENLKKHYEGIIREKEQSISAKATKNEAANASSVDEIIQDIDKEFQHSNQTTPPPQAHLAVAKFLPPMQAQEPKKELERRSKRTSSRIITSRSNALKAKKVPNFEFSPQPTTTSSNASSSTTASLAHYAYRSSSTAQRRIRTTATNSPSITAGTNSDDNFV